MCTHDWQPIPNWYARYRCTLCDAYGCKFGVVAAPYGGKRSVEIRPYRCEATCGGERCNRDAVHATNGRKFRCAEHPYGVRTARARKVEERASPSEETVTPGQGEEARK